MPKSGEAIGSPALTTGVGAGGRAVGLGLPFVGAGPGVALGAGVSAGGGVGLAAAVVAVGGSVAGAAAVG